MAAQLSERAMEILRDIVANEGAPNLDANNTADELSPDLDALAELAYQFELLHQYALHTLTAIGCRHRGELRAARQQDTVKELKYGDLTEQFRW